MSWLLSKSADVGLDDQNHDAVPDDNGIGQALRTYRLVYRREPPWGYDAWVQYAVNRRCRVDSEVYRGIDESLAPFRQNPPSRATLRKAYDELDDVGFITIRNGSVTQYIIKGRYGNFDRGDAKNRSTEFAAFLPDMDILVNMNDNPRVWWPEPLPELLQARLDSGELDFKSAFKEHGCRATDFLSRWHALYSFAIQPFSHSPLVHYQVPMVSFATIKGCFADVSLPRGVYSYLHHGQCAPKVEQNDITWQDKITALYWKGSNTGSDNVIAQVSKELQLKFHRNRLVAWARARSNSSLYNIGFTQSVQGDGIVSLEVNGGKWDPYEPMSEIYRYKYLLVIDGNSASARYITYLCSSSLVFKVEGTDEWFHDRLRPWVHYIPVSLDLNDLEQRVHWAIENDAEAQEIVKRANKVVSEETREEDMACYWYRYLIEYGSIKWRDDTHQSR